jgi:hypothetical protein
MSKKLHQCFQLPYVYNVKNTTQLLQDLNDIMFGYHTRLASFDITNMYTNIPTGTLLQTFESLCQTHIPCERTTHDLLKIPKLLLKQNYLRFQDSYVTQKEGLARIHDIMEIIYNTSKGRFMNTIKQYHIYSITQINIQINDKNTAKPNAIFKTLVQELPNR